MLRLCLQRALQEGRLHQDLRPKLEARRGLGHGVIGCWPSRHSVDRGVCEHRPQRTARRPRGPGEQGLHQAQAGDGDPQRREAPQSREDPAEQEDGSLLRTSAGRHHRGHQAGLRGRQEAVHTGRETGEGSFQGALLVHYGFIRLGILVLFRRDSTSILNKTILFFPQIVG